MADRGDTHYHVPNLNRWFLLSSLLLLVSTVWMMIDDWAAPWKEYQREFREVEAAKVAAALEELERPETLAEEAELRAAVAAAQAELDERRDELDAAQEVLFQEEGDRYAAEETAKRLKAQFNWDRYQGEERLAELEREILAAADPAAARAEHAAEMQAIQERLDDSARAVAQAEAALEEEQLERAAAQGVVDEMRARLEEAETQLAAETRDLDRLRVRLEGLMPSELDVKLANVIRDAPGLDFIGPSLQVQKVVLDDLTFDLNFTTKTRIDMCATCHMGIEREGFEDVEQPLTTHPRLDLFLSAASPHPMSQVGCTICHRGSGEALDFIRADHRPSSAAEALEWEEEYHWHKQHHWDYPMLASDYIEASCVQCHTTSMELIADEAPKVTEGYRAFERFGCYACHKVEWFPEERKPGPSLTNFQAKLKDEWLEPWIAGPRDFRPSTWMPHFFHLENFAPDETVVVAEYGQGRDIKGEEWNSTAVSAVATFLRASAPEQSYPEIPVAGDAERGREVFRLVGCLACHNLEPYPDESEPTRDPAWVASGENEHGPNLRGVATKLEREWLFWWLKDPAQYWPETRMPDLRLSDQDAADITAYLMDDPDGVFTDVPEDWVAEPSPASDEVLREMARWFYSNQGRGELARRFAGEVAEHRWDRTEELGVAVGERLVMNYGCYSCHTINGMEDMMPIGAELTSWGSKTVDKLDFGYAYRMDLGGRPKLDHHYREGWLERKLHAPRSYDEGKVKNPKEKLRMPWFDFSDEEIQAIATFVVGLVEDEVQLAKMEPTAGELAMDRGQRVLRQKNCASCHVLEPSLLTYRDEEGEEHTVAAEALALEYDSLPAPMDGHQELLDYITRYEERNEEEVDEVGFRLLEVEPDAGMPGDKLYVERDDIVAIEPAKGGDFVRTVMDYYYWGMERFDAEAPEGEQFYSVTGDPDGETRVQDVDGEWRSYWEEPYDKLRWTFAPPVLLAQGFKVQPEWFYSFLLDPVALRQQMRVRMPTFHYEPGEAEAVAAAFAHMANEAWPSRYTRRLRLTLGLDIDEDAPEEARRWPWVAHEASGARGISRAELGRLTGLDAETIRKIEAGDDVATRANFEKVLAYGHSVGFTTAPAPNPEFERVQRRAPSYLAARREAMAPEHDPLALGRAVAIQGPNCYQCHFYAGQAPDQAGTPIAWAPDLALTRERLREDWVREWLIHPGLIYPGTAMPANFAGDPPQYQDVYPDSTNPEQVQVVLDWLYNFDRTPPVSD